MKTLKYPMFDGKKIWEGAKVTIDGGKIVSVTECPSEECDNGFLMPGLIDAHTHTESISQVERMHKYGIVATCDVEGLKVAAHATELATVRQAVDAGVDILLHVPMKEKYPVELAQEIADKGICVAPTLVMMEKFSVSGRNGYQPEHYKNAEAAVNLLYNSGVKILAATDANSGGFSPEVPFGPSIHREMELLADAGLNNVDVLKSVTSTNAEVFGIDDIGMIEEGKRSDILLIDGRPDRNITDIAKIISVMK